MRCSTFECWPDQQTLPLVSESMTLPLKFKRNFLRIIFPLYSYDSELDGFQFSQWEYCHLCEVDFGTDQSRLIHCSCVIGCQSLLALALSSLKRCAPLILILLHGGVERHLMK